MSASAPVSAAQVGVIHGRPSTFAERGVCVPFTTPILAQARIRMDAQERLECLLPGFSGGKGTYVFGWKALPEVIRITLHDRALHREILETKANTPDTIRHCSLQVAARGFAGLAAAAQARQALALDRDYTVLTNYVFVLELLKQVGTQAPDLLRAGLDSEATRQRAKSALTRVAEGFGMVPDMLYGRVEELSTLLAPLGLPQAPHPGRLRQLMRRLEWFRDDVATWAVTEATEAESLARFMAECADQTLTIAATRLARVDPLLTRLRPIVTGEEKSLREVRAGVTSLSWLLDGWDYICQHWEDSRAQSDEVQRLAMCELFRIAPIIPVQELAANENFDMEELRRVQRRWVRANQDWRTGGLDYDAIRRIETVKAKLA
ncbi:hypothetical protein [Rhodocista pekingensis]|uniref:Uncharacterized protein n=1 Tax=Rhodocista pekingensis TaxID=201185 RepID=A0ABW2KY32_9PROT